MRWLLIDDVQSSDQQSSGHAIDIVENEYSIMVHIGTIDACR
jgi:hypothetical protein